MASSSDMQLVESNSYTSSTWSEATDRMSACDTTSHSSNCDSQGWPSQGTNATGASVATLSYQQFELCLDLCSDQMKEFSVESHSKCEMENSIKEAVIKGCSASQRPPIRRGISSPNTRNSIASTSLSITDRAYAESWNERGPPETPQQGRKTWQAISASSSGEDVRDCEVEYFPSWTFDVNQKVSLDNPLEAINKKRLYAWQGNEPSTDCPISSAISNSVDCLGELQVEDIADESIWSGTHFPVVEEKGTRENVPTYLPRYKFLRLTERLLTTNHTGPESYLSSALKVPIKEENNRSVIENMAVPFVLEPSDDSEFTKNISWPGKNSKQSRRWRDVAEILPSVRGFSRRMRHKGDRTENNLNHNDTIIRKRNKERNSFFQEPVVGYNESSLINAIKYGKPLEMKSNDINKYRECDKSDIFKQIPHRKHYSKSTSPTSEIKSLPVKDKEINDLKSKEEDTKNNCEPLFDRVYKALPDIKLKRFDVEKQVYQEIVCVSPEKDSVENTIQSSYVSFPSKHLNDNTIEKIEETEDKICSIAHDHLNEIDSVSQYLQENRTFNESATLHLSNINNCADTGTESILLGDEQCIEFCGNPKSYAFLESKENNDRQTQEEYCNLEIKQKVSSTSSNKDSVLDSQKSSVKSDPMRKKQDLVVHNSSEVTNVLQNNELDELSEKFAKNLHISLKDHKQTLCNDINRINTDVDIKDHEWYTAHHELSVNGIRVKSEDIQSIEQSSKADNKISSNIEGKPRTFCENSDSGLTLGESRNESEDQFSYNALHNNQSSPQISKRMSEATQLNGDNLFDVENLSLDFCASTLNQCAMPQLKKRIDQRCNVSKNIQAFKEVTMSASIMNPLFSRKRTCSTTVLFFNSFQPFKKLKRPSSCTFHTDRFFVESSYNTNQCGEQLFSKSYHKKNSFQKETRKNQINFENEYKKVIHSFKNDHCDLNRIVNYGIPSNKRNKEESYRSNDFVFSKLVPNVSQITTLNIVQEHFEFTGPKTNKVPITSIPASTPQDDDSSATISKQYRHLTELSSTVQTHSEFLNQPSTSAGYFGNDHHEGQSTMQKSGALLDTKMFSNPIQKREKLSREETGSIVPPISETSDCRSSKWSRKEDSGGSCSSGPRSDASKGGGGGAWLVAKDDASSESRSEGAKRRPAWWNPKEKPRKRLMRRARRAPPPGEGAPGALGPADTPRCRRALLPLLSQPPPSPLRQRRRRKGHPVPIFRRSGTSSESISPVRDIAPDRHRKCSRQVSRSFLEKSNIFSKGKTPSTFEKYSRYYKQFYDNTNMLQERRKSGKTHSSNTSSKSRDNNNASKSQCSLKRSGMRIALLSRDSLPSSHNTETDFPSTVSDSKDITAGGNIKSGEQLSKLHRKRKRPQNLSKSFSEFQTLKKQLANRTRGLNTQMFQSSFSALPGTCFVPVPILQPRTSWIRRSKNVTLQRSHPLLSPVATASSTNDLATGYTLVQGVCAPNEGSRLTHPMLPLESVVPLALGPVPVPQLMVPVNWQQDLTPSSRVCPPGEKVSPWKTEWLQQSQVVSSVSPAFVHVLCIQPVAEKRCEK